MRKLEEKIAFTSAFRTGNQSILKTHLIIQKIIQLRPDH